VSEETDTWRSIQIEATDGRAEVYQHGRLVGATPYELRARVGERVELELKRDGVSRQVEFFVTHNRKNYTYSVK
jgi:hypothetical protein